MTSTIAPTAVLRPNVQLGDDSRVEDFVLLGVAPSGAADGELALAIGRAAVIRSHAVLYAGNTIGERFQAGHGVLIRESNTFGDEVSIGSHTVIEHHVLLGRGVRVHSNAFIPEFSVLEDEAWVGPCAVFTNARYPRSPRAKEELAGPRIGFRARIGANVTLLPGVVVGRDALIGAGSVVVRDIPDGAVAVGNPARVVRRLADIGAYALPEDS
jgi:acetyltransferase-like isoleucine patch superfamily enzyme